MFFLFMSTGSIWKSMILMAKKEINKMTNNEKYLVVGAGNISKKHIDNIKRLKKKQLGIQFVFFRSEY